MQTENGKYLQEIKYAVISKIWTLNFPFLY